MSELDLRRALAGLEVHLPHATFGFSPGYRWEPATRTRVLELSAQDVPALHARIASTGLPIGGPQGHR